MILNEKNHLSPLSPIVEIEENIAQNTKVILTRQPLIGLYIGVIWVAVVFYLDCCP